MTKMKISPEAQAKAEKWAEFLKSTIEAIEKTGTTTAIKLFGDELETIKEMASSWSSTLQSIPPPVRARLEPGLVEEIHRNLIALQQSADDARTDLKGDPEAGKRRPGYKSRWIHIAIYNWKIIWETDTGKKASKYVEGDFYQFASKMLKKAGVHHNHKHLIEEALTGYDPGSAPLPHFSPLFPP